jgi:hypothetical protein
LILYTDVNKIKMGDGATKVTQLPFLSDEDTKNLTEMTGILPLSKGGTGRSLLTSTNVNGILRAPDVLDDEHNLLITRTNNGAMYATE